MFASDKSLSRLETSLPLTHGEAIARARHIALLAREYAAEGEATRRLPEPVLQAILESGLVRLLVPKRFGGLELSFDAYVDATLEVGKADGSAAWCFSFVMIHAWLLAHFSEQAQRDVWSVDPDACLANVNIPAGQATPVEGGYRVSGAWPFASGIDHAHWAMLAGIVPPEPTAPPGPPEVRLFLIPRADFTIEDTWHVTGQRGTGSKTVKVAARFVPAHRTVTLAELREAQAPGRAVHDGPLYQMTLLAALTPALLAPLLGAAKGAYECWRESSRSRCTTYSREQIAMLSHQQIRLAEVAAELDAAELILRRALDLMRPGVTPTLEQRVRLRRDYAYAATLCVRATERIYVASGGGANYESNPLQRYWRDVHAMASHAGLNFDAAGENFGRMELGLPLNPKDPLF